MYRRFGRTELQMPVLTCGGMRYQQSWKDVPGEEITDESQQNLEACIRAALDAGIHHIETARGYGTSELQLGRILPTLPRDKIIVQTKIPPKESEDAFLDVFEQCMRNLQLDYVDLLGIHGINNAEVLQQAIDGGTMRAAQKLRDRGAVRHIGFSTHGRWDDVNAAIETDLFDYVNLHWYYVDQRNWPAIEAATAHDMGVFIISPNDKGGKLYAPPDKLEALCKPLTPMGFNDLFCLADPKVHTLSIGVARPADFDAHLAVLPHVASAADTIAPIRDRLEREMVNTFDADWAAHWQDGLPRLEDVPGNVPLYHVVRLYNLVKAYDMLEFGKMRYNLLGNGGHWFPGNKVDKLDWEKLPAATAAYRFADRLPAILREAHDLMAAEEVKRLSESAE